MLSVVNLQEAYAKALLVDRPALAQAQLAGDVLGGHELLLDAFNTDVRPLCARYARALGARRGPGRRVPSVGLRGTRRPSGAPVNNDLRKADTMSVTTQIVNPIPNAGTTGREPTRRRRSRRSLLASHLLGGNRALANFGGGNTSAKGDRHRPHRPRDRGDLGQGLGQRPGDDGGVATSPRCASTRSCRCSSATR